MMLEVLRRSVPRVRSSVRGALCSGACLVLAAGCAGLDPDVVGDVLGGHGHSGHGHSGPGTPPPPPATSCGFHSSDDVYALIAADLAQRDADDTAFTRYLTLANEANANGCGAALDGSRAALNKLVNSLSLDASVTQLLPIDADLTTYRLDLRDYAWDRSVEVNGIGFADAWEAIVASSPYAIPYVGDDADDAVADSGTTVPVLFGNAFVAAATEASTYYGVLGIPGNVDDFLLDDLGIDVEQNRVDQEIVRAGLGGTGQGISEFLVERHEIEVRAGYVYEIFSGEAGAADLVNDPLGTPASEEREIVFTLPNGLLGHILANGDGELIDESNQLLDTNENNFRAKVARSYFGLRADGVTATDGIRAFTIANAADFSDEEVAAILAVYPSTSDLESVLLADRAVFAGALASVGIDIDDQPEPIRNAFAEFDRDVVLATAAGDLYVTAEELESNLDVLDPALSVLDGGSMDRDDFTALYLFNICVLSVVNENQPDPAVCDQVF
jgi:hypothetical protein